MESRGNQVKKKEGQRPPISRRSCDHCRARKIRCDRKTPCSNCASARLECIHSAVASNTSKTGPRQRILLSQEYEKKIDGIVRDLSDIKQLLQKPPETSHSSLISLKHSGNQLFPNIFSKSFGAQRQFTVNTSYKQQHGAKLVSHMVNFINCVADFPDPASLGTDSWTLISSLRASSDALKYEMGLQFDDDSTPRRKNCDADISMPPQEAAVLILRWARDAQNQHEIAWLFDILPLERISDICKKVYFAIDDYEDLDVVLASGCLRYLFIAHARNTGTTDCSVYTRMCQINIRKVTARMPLILPATGDAIAALVICSLEAMESCELETASTLILNAANLCQRFGQQHFGAQDAPETANRRLLWTVYKLEHAISLRIGRDPALGFNAQVPCDTQARRLGKLSGLLARVWSAESKPSARDVQDLVNPLEDLRDQSHETRESLVHTPATGFIRLVCLQSEILAQSSLLGILTPFQNSTSINDVAARDLEVAVCVARNIMATYRQYLDCLKGYQTILDTSPNWFLHNTPFTSFRVLFSHAVQAPSADDLCLLEAFASSLSTFCRGSEMKAQPIHVYQLLCQAARFTLKGSSPAQGTQKALVNPDVSLPMLDLLRDSTKASEPGTLESLLDEESLIEDHVAVDLGDWWTLEDDTNSGTMPVAQDR